MTNITTNITEDTNWKATILIIGNPYDDDGSTGTIIVYCDDMDDLLRWIIAKEFNYIVSIEVVNYAK